MMANTQTATKSWVAVVGGLLAVLIPLVLQIVVYLPPQWAAGVTGVIALLTAFGVYKVPNATIIPGDHTDHVHAPVATESASDDDGNYSSPWLREP
jgi:hypothetical protein